MPGYSSGSGSAMGLAVLVEPRLPRRIGGSGCVSFFLSVLVDSVTSRVFCSSLSRDVLRRDSTATASRMARPVFLASYARWRQLREQYRLGLLPSDSGTGVLRQCSHRRRPSSSRGMSYFVMG
jgi:hypothetical protein